MAVQRYRIVQGLAVLIGLAVFAAHVVTIHVPDNLPEALQFTHNDWVAHFGMLFLFTMVYRLSYAGTPAGTHRATLFICSGWGAFCEFTQIFLPHRDFQLLELGINTLTPAVVVALSAMFSRR